MVGAVGLVFAGVLAINLDETVQPVRDHHDGCLAGRRSGPVPRRRRHRRTDVALVGASYVAAAAVIAVRAPDG